MTQSTHPTSPLRQRMIEDMQMRKLAPKTQASYLCAVKKLADYLGYSPHFRYGRRPTQVSAAFDGYGHLSYHH